MYVDRKRSIDFVLQNPTRYCYPHKGIIFSDKVKRYWTKQSIQSNSYAASRSSESLNGDNDVIKSRDDNVREINFAFRTL